jgi:beta-galactosidase
VIKVDYTLEVKPGLPNIPKVGMQMGILKEYTQIEYFGKGPLENYVDRRYGMDAGVYKQDIYEFMEPYVVPQENGNRTDIRWMYLSNPKTKDGLLIVADSLLSMSAWPYTEDNIENAKHTNKLKVADYITLNIDLVQMGVGGNDSWSDVSAPLQQYQVKSRSYHYSFYMVYLNTKEENAGEMAKTIKHLYE